MNEKTIYLAGPEVFYPNAVEIGRNNKQLCKRNFATGLYPLDNEIDTSLPKDEQARIIVEGNTQMIKQADMIFANLSNFRGSTQHPYCDAGTAWECGYAIGLGDKIVIGYTDNPNSIPQTIINNIHLVLRINRGNSAISEVFRNLDSIVFRTITIPPITLHHTTLVMDPPFQDILDVNSESAFWAGYYYAKGQKFTIELSDKRPMVEKYGGSVDKNGNSIEDFGYPMNIMIAVTS